MAEEKTLIGLFPTARDADRVVSELYDMGIDADRVSVMAREDVVNNFTSDNSQDDTQGVGDEAATGAKTGAWAGGILGLLAGLGAIVVPGIGPVITAGSIAAAITSTAVGAGVGAAGGGVIGALLGLGTSKDEAEVYAEGVKRGGVLVAVAANGKSADIRDVFQSHNVVDIDSKKHEWQDEGWQHFDTSDDWEDEYPSL